MDDWWRVTVVFSAVLGVIGLLETNENPNFTTLILNLLLFFFFFLTLRWAEHDTAISKLNTAVC